MKQTSGSIKLLEENLNARYKGLEAAKEGETREWEEREVTIGRKEREERGMVMWRKERW